MTLTQVATVLALVFYIWYKFILLIEELLSKKFPKSNIYNFGYLVPCRKKSLHKASTYSSNPQSAFKKLTRLHRFTHPRFHNQEFVQS